MNKNYRIFTEEINYNHKLIPGQEIVRVREIKNELQYYVGIVTSVSDNVSQIIWAEKFWFPKDLLKGDENVICDDNVICASPFNETACDLLSMFFELKSTIKY